MIAFPFSLSFHWYGVILGLAATVGVLCVERKALKYHLDQQLFWQAMVWVLTGGLIGARLYHVWTDFELYQYRLLDIFKIWNGGLSIIGAALGAALSTWVFVRFFIPKNSPKTSSKNSTKLTFFLLGDLAVFGLPLAQAIGRWGNFVNQELYGLPTSLPWGIPIEAEHRLAGLENYSYFHPLFAYEMIFTFCFWVCVWFLDAKNLLKKTPVGSGKLFIIYLTYYSIVRYFLDFLRPDKAVLTAFPLGLNQLVLLVVIAISSGWLLWQMWHKKITVLIVWIMLMLVLATSSFFITQNLFRIHPSSVEKELTLTSLQNVPDHQIVTLQVGQKKLQVEVVNTPASIQQGLSDRMSIGSDGMLFVFSHPQKLTFWMYQMRFNLDLVWINNGQVIEVSSNVPAPFPGQATNQLPVFSPQGMADMVLELEANNATAWGIQPGTNLRLPR